MSSSRVAVLSTRLVFEFTGVILDYGLVYTPYSSLISELHLDLQWPHLCEALFTIYKEKVCWQILKIWVAAAAVAGTLTEYRYPHIAICHLSYSSLLIYSHLPAHDTLRALPN